MKPESALTALEDASLVSLMLLLPTAAAAACLSHTAVFSTCPQHSTAPSCIHQTSLYLRVQSFEPGLVQSLTALQPLVLLPTTASVPAPNRECKCVVPKCSWQKAFGQRNTRRKKANGRLVRPQVSSSGQPCGTKWCVRQDMSCLALQQACCGACCIAQAYR